jgi:ATP-dependent exoDNAse (exonuclease V) beta subunit
VDPLFEVATEDEAERLYKRAFDRWLEEKLGDPPPGIRRLLRQPFKGEEGPVAKLHKAGWDLIDRRDFPAPWEIRPYARDAEIDHLVSRLLGLAEKAGACCNPEDYLYRAFRDLRSFAVELERRGETRGERDYDYLEHRLPALDLGKWKGRGPYAEGVFRDDLIAERDSLKEALTESHLQNELRELVERYQSLMEKAGRLDFLDLLVRARDLLVSHGDLRRELQARFTHIFVDEFQDTDPLQAEILILLASDDPTEADWRNVRPTAGKLFIVADPKQSIYRFRRADVALYQQIKRQLLDSGAELVYLSVSFRAVPDLQELVNRSMSEVMTGSQEASQASYVPLNRFREPIDGQPAVIALPIPRPYSNWGNLANYAIERSEPGAVAAWVKWVLEESGWQVTSRDNRDPHPISPSDICLLFRRFVSGNRVVTQPYVDALQARDIPHVLVGGRGFHLREEIETMRNALGAIERPDDELSVFATLRGYLFSLSDEALFLFRTRHGSLHPFRKLPEDLESSDADVAAALDVLAKLHKGRNRRPIALTIRQLLDETRAQTGFALWQAGDQVLANVLRLLQLARNYESTGGLSFRGFVEHLERLAEEGQTSEQPLIEEGVEGVRLMTVHRAKGLEFPLVILCDITCTLGVYASRHIDSDERLFAVRLAGAAPWELLDHEDLESTREEAESQRLLYVAATRARDLLVIPAVADEQRKRSWVSTLYTALYPTGQTYRLPVVAPGCPRFGDDTVIDRPSKSPVLSGDGIRPGMHKPRRGHHRVVWWDPHLLEESPAGKPGVRRYQILQPKDEPTEEKGKLLHEQWLGRKESLLETGCEVSMLVTTATRKAETTTEVPGDDEIEVARVERVRGRPVGKAFGTLVHETLASADLDAEADTLRSLTRTLGRLLGNTDEEIEAAGQAVERALEHPLLRRAQAASRLGLCHRETPFVYREPDGGLIEGVADLAFRDDPGSPWTVVDFKTDARLDIGQDAYRRQVALYMQALHQSTGADTKGVLLYV